MQSLTQYFCNILCVKKNTYLKSTLVEMRPHLSPALTAREKGALMTDISILCLDVLL